MSEAKTCPRCSQVTSRPLHTCATWLLNPEAARALEHVAGVPGSPVVVIPVGECEITLIDGTPAAGHDSPVIRGEAKS